MANQFEQLQKQFDNATNDAKHVVAQRYAKKFVDAFRKHLAQFKLNNHTILACSGMGCCYLIIKNKLTGEENFLEDYGYSHDSSILNELRSIEELLDWDWCYNLDNTPLN